MPSRLGRMVRQARLAKGLGLRELARLVGKSGTYLVTVESADDFPGMSEETLRRLAEELSLDADTLLTIAHKTPSDVRPRTARELYLYRLVRDLPRERQNDLITELEGARPQGSPPRPANTKRKRR